MTSSLKWVLGCVVPHSAVTLRQNIQRQRAVALRRAAREELARAAVVTYSYEDSIAWLASQGVDEDQIRGGSIPERSLSFIEGYLSRFLAPQPVTALHIGNFVGVSLAYVVNALRSIDPESLVIAVDPNIPHRGVSNPQDHTARLLSRYGLQKNCLLVCGYSLSKNHGDDGGYIYGDKRLSQVRYATEAASEEVLANLGCLLSRKIDCAFIDGNHDGTYLAAELKALGRLLRPGGVLVLDDVSEAWFEISGVFEEFKRERQVEKSFQDGRVGLAVLE